MKTTLFIGSTVLDIVVNTDRLPTMKEDINTLAMNAALGGCSYNAASITRHLKLPHIHCTPCGEGFFADAVKMLMTKQNLQPYATISGIDNGCCLCLVDESGERTFLSHHGAEYLFDPQWLKDIDPQTLDMVYVCGLEIEDKNGEELLDALAKLKPAQIIAAPGARIEKIQPERMEKLFALHPILHLNDDEALAYTHSNDVQTAAEKLYALTHNTLIITCGAKGAYLMKDGQGETIEGYQTTVVDTIGAGDSHIGAWISAMKTGISEQEAVRFANYVASRVVSVQGPALPPDEITAIQTQFKTLI